MERERWTPLCGPPKLFGAEPYSVPGEGGDVPVDICPGFLLSQPWAHEAGQALAAFRTGCLVDFFPGEENAVFEAALTYQAAMNSFEVWRIRERIAQQKNGGTGG